MSGPKSGKYPLGNRLYHLAILVVGLTAAITGMFMMARVRQPFFTRNPASWLDPTWGFTYVAHGLAGVGLVGLVIAHVYFAVRPEKWWITKSMIPGGSPAASTSSTTIRAAGRSAAGRVNAGRSKTFGPS